jgi:RNA polymerase sigma-70 factor (sigma-E family)
MSRSYDPEFTEFILGGHRRLLQFAYLVCGDWHRAEDAVQATLIRLYVAWPRISNGAGLETYARKTVLSVVRDDARRPWRRERPADRLPDRHIQDGVGQVDERLLLLSALQALPRRQRAAVVLRYFGELSVEDTAEVLGCSQGTVKSQTARGLAGLRKIFAERGVELHEPDPGRSQIPEETPWSHSIG